MNNQNNNEYIISNEDWDDQEPMETVRMRNSSLPEGMEFVDEVSKGDQAIREIEEAAQLEGLAGKEHIGGVGATPEEVISALKNEAMPEGAKKNKEEYEDKKIEEFKEITATRELLFNRLKKPVNLYIKVGQTEDGIPVKMKFVARKLSESENNHIINHKLIGKNFNELSKAEYDESMRFRRKTLSQAIIKPALTEAEWGENVENAVVIKLFDELQNKVLAGLNDSEIFR